MARKHLVLSVFVQQYGTHGRAWRRPNVPAGGKPSFDRWADLVHILERGKFDLAFFADFVGADADQLQQGGGRRPRGEGFEPLSLIGALTRVTTKIGLVATVNTNTNNPYNLARQLSSLDHLSGGRVGWNIVSSLQDTAIKSFGLKNTLDHDERYERASEFVDLTRELWDSWDDDAFDHPDKETGRFFDPASAHPVHHHGKYFDADTVLDVARPLWRPCPSRLGRRIGLLLPRRGRRAFQRASSGQERARERADHSRKLRDLVVDRRQRPERLEVAWPSATEARARRGAQAAAAQPLAAREFALLAHLVARPGRVLSRQEILREVWDPAYGGSPRTVDIHVRRLRKKLGTALPLETLRGLGYKLAASPKLEAGPRTRDGLSLAV